MIAKPIKLAITSAIPWYMCDLTKQSVLFSRSACVKTFGGQLVSSKREILNNRLQLKVERIDRSTRCRNVGAVDEDSEKFGKSVSEPFANRSCVARRDPRKRLCGMTVAPRIPTAETTMSNRTER